MSHVAVLDRRLHQRFLFVLFFGTSLVIQADTFCIGLGRVGWDSQKIAAGTMSLLKDFDLGPPIHSLIIPGKMHFLEEDLVKQFLVNSTVSNWLVIPDSF